VAVALAVIAGLAFALVLVTRRPDATDAADAAEPSAASVSLPASAAVLADLDAALTAWGEFAVSGDLSVLDATFAGDGPQRAQLATEAAAIAADPPGPPPYLFTVVDHDQPVVEAGVAVVVATIELVQPGSATSSFRWRIELRWDSAAIRWQLWTVASVDDNR